MSNDNLKLWNSLQKTDPLYVSDKDKKGLSSINTQYFFLRATEAFGVCGIGWGYEIEEERLDDGVEVFNDKKESLGFTKNHTIKLRLWFKVHGEKGEVISFGHTPYIYKSKWGMTVDDEAPKKSLSDSIKKALSMIGVAADVYLKHFDNQGYRQEVHNEIAMKNAEDKDAEAVKQAREHDEWKLKELEAYKNLNSENALKNAYTAHVRKCQRVGDDKGVIQFTKAKDERKKELGLNG